MVEAADRQLQRLADALGTLPFTGVDRAPEARIGRDLEGLRELGGRNALVAGQGEADDVGMRSLGRLPRHPERPLGSEVPDR